ncbi:ATP-binding cassette glutathione S-conjugate transporter ycf1 [Coemansia sp. RSA 1804]|nr:ATP-binding cassette glutathione S-conjugate transporter ycf1 [Coemansia sp. RSA 1804]
MVATIAIHTRRLLFVSILGLLQNGVSSRAFVETGIRLAIWQVLGLSVVFQNYLNSSSDIMVMRISKLMEQRVLKIYSTKHGQSDDDYEISHKILFIARGIPVFANSLGKSVAEIFNVWIIASKIGWRFVIPIAISIVHTSLSWKITDKINLMRRQNREAEMPDFRKNFEVLCTNIRPIKFFGWEEAFRGMQAFIDVPTFIPSAFWRLANYIVDTTGSAISQIAAAVTITSYLGTNKTLAYTDVAILLDSIQSLMNFVNIVANTSDMYKNIRQWTGSIDYMIQMEDNEYVEIDRSASGKAGAEREEEEKGGGSKVSVELSQCAFSWGPDKFYITPTSLTIKSGEMAMVVGRVGSGKSSFVTALCGEMPISSGTGKVYGTIGYVEQKPTILDDTVRGNILMGREFDEKFFWQVIEACDLVKDIYSMPDGDQTEVGSYGLKLSGGQKARLALARALYTRADVYIFDDLLSAVDSHVENHIVENVLSASGIIGNKTRILVTHATHLLPLSNKVISFSDGHAHITEQQPVETDSLTVASDESSSSSSSSSNTGSSGGWGMNGPDVDAAKSAKNFAKPQKSTMMSIQNSLDSRGFNWAHVHKYFRLSKYWRVTTVVLVQFVYAYSMHYISNIRISLMIDANSMTTMNSIKQYIKLNVLVAVTSGQLQYLESWYRINFWSRPLIEAMRKEATSAILNTTLAEVEDMKAYDLIMFFSLWRYYAAQTMPRELCSVVVHQCLTIMLLVVQVIRLSPALLLLLPFIMGLSIAAKIHARSIHTLIHSFNRDSINRPASTISQMISMRREFLRVLDVTGMFLRKLTCLYALEISIKENSELVNRAVKLINILSVEAMSTAALLYKVWQRYYMNQSISSGEVDAVISLLLLLVKQIQMFVSLDSSLSYNLNCVSLFFTYAEELPQEAPMAVVQARMPEAWPKEGTVEFKNYSLRYGPDLDPVLNNISFEVRGSEKIGIVGRTGAGKSTISQALTRLVEPAGGSILIDGVDISTIGLQDLRSRIGIIPQDPVLFLGTIRDNLDPLRQYTDAEIWNAVRAAQVEDLLKRPSGKYIKPTADSNSNLMMSEFNESGPWVEGVGLQKWVEKGGSNFSVGQRQLISLCRVLLWRRKILLLDEATANVDPKTDRIMQEVIRREFKDCTILTIAHRLGTVMDSDRILVVDDGRIVEFDTPSNLLATGGHFAQMFVSTTQIQKLL